MLLFGTHLFLTVRTGFIQRFLPKAIKLSFSREKEGEGDVSQFAALMTALAATIGTGNSVGVAGGSPRAGRARRGAVDVADRRVWHRHLICLSGVIVAETKAHRADLT